MLFVTATLPVGCYAFPRTEGFVVMVHGRRAVESALAEFGASVGEGLSLDGNGVLSVEFADGIVVTMELPQPEERLYFHAPVTRIPADAREAMLTQALRRNLFNVGPAGAALALDDDSDQVLLCYSTPVEGLASDGLSGILLAMVTEVRSLRAALDSGVETFAAEAGAERDGTFFIRG